MSLALLLLAAPLYAQDPASPAPTSAQVVSVYDGDTFTLDTGDKVRVMWINTPELKPLEDYGVEAREATEAFVGGGYVDLTYGGAERDGYGRLLGQVSVNGRWLAEDLIEKGLAHVFLIPPVGDDTPVEALLAAQARARAANRGIWSTERYQGTLHITSFHANADGDDRDNVNGEYLRVANVTTEPVNLDGYRLHDASGNSWILPPLTLPAGYTVKIHSGVGEHGVDPMEQLTIYLGSETPIWNNDYDRATLYDRYGRVMDSKLHKPASKPQK
jgi:endonuclease YncB( thermonuclease family)